LSYGCTKGEKMYCLPEVESTVKNSLIQGALQEIDFIGFFPRENVPAEVSVGRTVTIAPAFGLKKTQF